MYTPIFPQLPSDWHWVYTEGMQVAHGPLLVGVLPVGALRGRHKVDFLSVYLRV